jgi:hypothetical protein
MVGRKLAEVTVNAGLDGARFEMTLAEATPVHRADLVREHDL